VSKFDPATDVRNINIFGRILTQFTGLLRTNTVAAKRDLLTERTCLEKSVSVALRKKGPKIRTPVQRIHMQPNESIGASFDGSFAKTRTEGTGTRQITWRIVLTGPLRKKNE